MATSLNRVFNPMSTALISHKKKGTSYSTQLYDRKRFNCPQVDFEAKIKASGSFCEIFSAREIFPDGFNKLPKPEVIKSLCISIES